MSTRSDQIACAMTKPARLTLGQTIGITAPSSPPNEPEGVRFAIDTVESLGFRVKPAPHLFDRNGYLAGDDATHARYIWIQIPGIGRDGRKYGVFLHLMAQTVSALPTLAVHGKRDSRRI